MVIRNLLRWKKVLKVCVLISIFLLASCGLSEKSMEKDLGEINKGIDAFQALPEGTVKYVYTVGQTKTETILYFIRTEAGIDYEKRAMHSEPRPPEFPPVKQGEKREKGIFYRMDYDTQEWIETQEQEGVEPLSEIFAIKIEEISQVSHIRKVKEQGGHHKYVLTPTPEYVRDRMKHITDDEFEKTPITIEITYEIGGDGVINRALNETFMELTYEDGKIEEVSLRMEIQYEKGKLD